jgi:hypothetical protein
LRKPRIQVTAWGERAIYKKVVLVRQKSPSKKGIETKALMRLCSTLLYCRETFNIFLRGTVLLIANKLGYLSAVNQTRDEQNYSNCQPKRRSRQNYYGH